MELTQEIVNLRPYLFSIAYNMLGVIEEAEDIVQDVFEKWIYVDKVNQPKAYLARMVVNHSINRRHILEKEQQTYLGTWLPEPYITTEPPKQHTLEYGMLYLMERLNPIERAVFILRESLSEDYQYISELTGLTIENCRQVLHRGREKLGSKRIRHADPVKQRDLTEAFLTALYDQNREVLEAILVKDIELYSDGGGKRPAAMNPLYGFEKVLKFLLSVTRIPKNPISEFGYKHVFINGLPGMLIHRISTNEIDTMQYAEVHGGRIMQLLAVRNPDKLKIQEWLI